MYNFKIILSLIFSMLYFPALASLPLTGAGSQVTGGGPPVCSNKLDFSDGCNSQYIPVV